MSAAEASEGSRLATRALAAAGGLGPLGPNDLRPPPEALAAALAEASAGSLAFAAAQAWTGVEAASLAVELADGGQGRSPSGLLVGRLSEGGLGRFSSASSDVPSLPEDSCSSHEMATFWLLSALSSRLRPGVPPPGGIEMVVAPRVEDPGRQLRCGVAALAVRTAAALAAARPDERPARRIALSHALATAAASRLARTASNRRKLRARAEADGVGDLALLLTTLAAPQAAGGSAELARLRDAAAGHVERIVQALEEGAKAEREERRRAQRFGGGGGGGSRGWQRTASPWTVELSHLAALLRPYAAAGQVTIALSALLKAVSRQLVAIALAEVQTTDGSASGPHPAETLALLASILGAFLRLGVAPPQACALALLPLLRRGAADERADPRDARVVAAALVAAGVDPADPTCSQILDSEVLGALSEAVA